MEILHSHGVNCMFDFLKKNDAEEEFDIIDMNALMEQMENTSIKLKYGLLTGEIKWSDEEVQLFLPIAMTFANWDWLELIAKNDCKKDYKAIKDFLDHCQALVKVNQAKLNEAM